MTMMKNAGARFVANVESIREILAAVEESMKRQGMQNPEGHDHQVFPGQEPQNRRDQIFIQALQMQLSGAKQGFAKLGRVARIQAELRELKLEHTQRACDLGDWREWHDL